MERGKIYVPLTKREKSRGKNFRQLLQFQGDDCYKRKNRTEIFSPAKFLGESPHPSAWGCLPAMVSLVSPLPFLRLLVKKLRFAARRGGRGKKEEKGGGEQDG